MFFQTPKHYKDTDYKLYWMPDDNCRECYECSAKFHPLRRRHHCRICGQIFCSQCCNREVPGKIMGFTGGTLFFCCNAASIHKVHMNKFYNVISFYTSPAMRLTIEVSYKVCLLHYYVGGIEHWKHTSESMLAICPMIFLIYFLQWSLKMPSNAKHLWHELLGNIMPFTLTVCYCCLAYTCNLHANFRSKCKDYRELRDGKFWSCWL